MQYLTVRVARLPRGGQAWEPPVLRRRDALGGRVRVGNPDDVAVLGL